MPITPERQNAITVARGMRQTLQNRTGLTVYGADSTTRAMLDIMVDDVVGSRNRMLEALYARQIGTARGSQLDEIGADLGVARLDEAPAGCSRDSRTMGFYVASGTFGDINGGLGFTIPAGTYVYSAANENESGAVIRYRLLSAVTCNSGSSVAYASIVAESSGTSHNVGPSILVNHDFTNYSGPGALLCVNFYSILNGRNREGDEAYRYRLSRNYDRLISSNESKTRLEALRVPGVVDVRILRGYYGIGTVAVAVLGSDYNSSTKILEGVQSRLKAMYGPGALAQAIPANAAYFDFEMEVTPVRTLNTIERRRLELDLRQIVFNYLRGIEIGGTVSLRDLAYEVQQRVAGSVRLRSNNATREIFSRIYVRRGSSPGVTDERAQMLGDSYTLGEIEYADLGTLSLTIR